VTHDPQAGIGRQDALQPGGRVVRAVGDDHHPRVNRHPDPDAAAVVDRNPARAAHGIEQRIEDRPVGDGVAPVQHLFGFAVGRRDGARVEVVAPDHHGSFQLAGADHVVEELSDLRPLSIS